MALLEQRKKATCKRYDGEHSFPKRVLIDSTAADLGTWIQFRQSTAIILVVATHTGRTARPLTFGAYASALGSLTHVLIGVISTLASTWTHDICRVAMLRTSDAINKDDCLDLPSAHGGLDVEFKSDCQSTRFKRVKLPTYCLSAVPQVSSYLSSPLRLRAQSCSPANPMYTGETPQDKHAAGCIYHLTCIPGAGSASADAGPWTV